MPIRTNSILITAGTLALSLWVAPSSPASTVTVGATPAYFTGNYGTSTTTNIFYLPLLLKYQENAVTLKLTVPYISIQSHGAVVSGGTVVGNNGATTTTTNSGLGDIWLEGRYRFRNGGTTPDITPYAKIKLGTASRSQGLGTGKNDYEGGVGLEWALGNAFPFADFGYRILGQPAGVTLNNIPTYDLGLTYKLDQKNYLTGMFSGHGSAQSGFADTADALIAWNYYTHPGSGLQVYVDKGLSNGSPDYGVGVGVIKRF